MSFDPLLTVLGLLATATETVPTTFEATAYRGGFALAPSVLPSHPTTGTFAVDSGDGNALKVWSGSVWHAMGGAAGLDGYVQFAASGVIASSSGLIFDDANNRLRAIGLAITAEALPGTPLTGQVAIDSGDSNKLKWWNGSSWQTAGGGGGGGISGSIALNQVAYGLGANTIQGSSYLMFDGVTLSSYQFSLTGTAEIRQTNITTDNSGIVMVFKGNALGGGSGDSSNGMCWVDTYNSPGNRQLCLMDSSEYNSPLYTGFRFVCGFPVPVIDAVSTDGLTVRNLIVGQSGSLLGVGFDAGSLQTDIHAQLHVKCGTASVVAFIVQAATSQSADLQEWQSSTGTVLAKVTASGELVTAASAAGTAGFNLPHGTAPSAPVNGDVWTTTTGIFARINGATVGPFASGTTPGGLVNDIQLNNGSGGFSGSDDFRWSGGLITSYGTLAALKLQHATDASQVMFGNASVTRWSIGPAVSTVAFTITLNDVGGSLVDTPVVIGSTVGSAITLARTTVVNTTGATAPTAITGTEVQLVGANSNAASTILLLDTACGTGGGHGIFVGRTSRGTLTSPTAIQAGDEMTSFEGYGYGTTAFSTSARGEISIYAAENWTDTAQGTRVGVFTTAPGGIVTTEKFRFWGDGGVSVGTNLAASPGAGVFMVTGAGTYTTLPNLRFQAFDTLNGYLQSNMQNLSNGAAASSDWICTADNGSDTINFVDMGINGSGWATGTWTVNGADDAYLYAGTTNIAIGTGGTGKTLRLFTGGTLAANARLDLTDTLITAYNKMVLPASTTGAASLNLPQGTAPSAPVDGDMWTTSAGVYARINGSTVGPFGTAGGSIGGSIANQQVAYGSGTNTIQGSANLVTDGTNLSVGTTISTTAFLTLGAPTTAKANLHLNNGVAPSAPANGDIWFDGTWFQQRQGGNTRAFLAQPTAGTAANRVFVSDAFGAVGTAEFTFSTNNGLTVAPVAQTTFAGNILTLTGAAHTALQAGSEFPDVTFNFSRTVQYSTGALAVYRSVKITPVTIAFVGASTLSDAATVAITGPPAAGTNATITRSYALWVQSGTLLVQAASTQDGVLLQGRAGGTTNLAVTITPGTLTASRILTLPDVAGTVTTGTGTANQVATWSGTNAVTGAAALTLTTTSGAALLANSSGTSTATTVVTSGLSNVITYTGIATTNKSSISATAAFTTGAVNTAAAVLTGILTQMTITNPILAGIPAGTYTSMSATPSGAVGAIPFFGAVNRAVLVSAANVFFASGTLIGSQSEASLSTANTSGAAVAAAVVGHKIVPSVTTTNASGTNTLASVYGLWVAPGTFSSTGGGGLTIANYYGLYIDTLTLTTMTVTNRYGIYQNDASAKNQFNGLVITAASTATTAGFRIPHGVAPSAPVDGDFWSVTTTGLFTRFNGVTALVTINLGVPSAESGDRTLTNADNSKNLICTGTRIFTVNTGLVSGFGCSFKGTVSFTGTATVTDVRTTGATNPWCALCQTGTDTYDIVGSKV